ncbi:MAG: EamA family transporter [Actinobacteria bacterium]|nr:EamA family transporter [Actinomycetota bacterium]
MDSTGRSKPSPGAFTVAAFAGAVLIGGANFLAVRFSNAELDPFWGAGIRFVGAAVIFIALAVALRLEWPRGKLLVLTAAYGIVNFTLSYALMYWALVTVTAGVAAVVLAIVPLVTPMLAAAQRLELLDRRAIIGALVALAGIVWMTVGPDGLVLPLSGLLAILVASVTVAQGVILGKRISGNHPAMTNAIGMVVGTVLLLALSAITGERWALPQETEVVVAVGYLVTLGSAGLFVLVLLIVRRWTASATAYSFVLFPVVTMLLEAWLADVPLTLRGVTGALVVMGGVWFGAFSESADRAPTPQAPVAAP